MLREINNIIRNEDKENIMEVNEELGRQDSGVLLGDGDKKANVKGILLNTSTHKKAKRKISWGAIKIREFIKNDRSWAQHPDLADASRSLFAHDKDIKENDAVLEERSEATTPSKEFTEQINVIEPQITTAPVIEPQIPAPLPTAVNSEPQQNTEPQTLPLTEQLTLPTNNVTSFAPTQPVLDKQRVSPLKCPPAVLQQSLFDASFLASGKSSKENPPPRRISEAVKGIFSGPDNSFQANQNNWFMPAVGTQPPSRRNRMSLDTLDLSGILYGNANNFPPSSFDDSEANNNNRRLSHFARDAFKTTIVSQLPAVNKEEPSIMETEPVRGNTTPVSAQTFLLNDTMDWNLGRLNSTSNNIPGISNSPITSSSFYNFAALPSEINASNLNLSQSIVRTLSPLLGPQRQDSILSSGKKLEESQFDNNLTSFNVGTLAGLAEDYPSIINSQDAKIGMDGNESAQKGGQVLEVLAAMEEDTPKPNGIILSKEGLKRKAGDLPTSPEFIANIGPGTKKSKLFQSPSERDRGLLRLDTVERKNLLKEMEPHAQSQPLPDNTQGSNNIFHLEQNNQREGSMLASPTFNNNENTNNNIEEQPSQMKQQHGPSSYITNLVMKSPTINTLQKKFLLNFLSPCPDRQHSPWTGAKLPSGTKRTIDFSNVNGNVFALMQAICQHKGQVSLKISLEYKKLKQIANELRNRVEEHRKRNTDLWSKFNKLQNPITEGISTQATLFRGRTRVSLPPFLPFLQGVLGYSVIKTYVMEMNVRIQPEGARVVLDSLAFHLQSLYKIPTETQSTVTSIATENGNSPTNPLRNKQTFMSLLGNTARNYLLKKNASGISKFLDFIAFKLRSLQKLSDLIDDLIIRHQIVALNVDTNSCLMVILFRLKNIPSKKIAFRLNLAKIWFEEIEMEMQDEELVKRLNAKQIESLNKRLITIFNREIANSSLDKLARMFSHLDAFRLISP